VFGCRRIFTEHTPVPCFWPDTVKFERPGRHSIPDARSILACLADYQNVMRTCVTASVPRSPCVER
jgi:hypothetical protein